MEILTHGLVVLAGSLLRGFLALHEVNLQFLHNHLTEIVLVLKIGDAGWVHTLEKNSFELFVRQFRHEESLMVVDCSSGSRIMPFVCVCRSGLSTKEVEVLPPVLPVNHHRREGTPLVVEGSDVVLYYKFAFHPSNPPVRLVRRSRISRRCPSGNP
jgi:hypothetical protein